MRDGREEREDKGEGRRRGKGEEKASLAKRWEWEMGKMMMMMRKREEMKEERVEEAKRQTERIDRGPLSSFSSSRALLAELADWFRRKRDGTGLTAPSFALLTWGCHQ